MEKGTRRPLSIAMWDFSWIERRWPGAGFEDIRAALRALKERGYDAVRIDVYPHLFAEGSDREWTILPVWSSNDWGSPYKVKIRLWPALHELLEECRRLEIKVGLSSWYREDTCQIRMKITSPEKMAENWLAVLDWIYKEGLEETLLYVDLCNEWPGSYWAPYFVNDPEWLTWSGWYTQRSMKFMRRSIGILREAYPQLPFCYSFDGSDLSHYGGQDLSFMDCVEHHIWMAKLNREEFYRELGKAENPLFTENAYHLLADRAYELYRGRKEYWDGLLREGVQNLAVAAKKAGLPLITTECWGLTDYKDYPMLEWGWIRDLCAMGTECAAQTGQWAVMATSNFASPQFAGMWRDVAWHVQLNERIHKAALPEELSGSRLEKMMWY